MKIRYKAIGKNGKPVEGLIEANDLNQAASYLRSKELTPVKLKNSQTSGLLKMIPFTSRVKSQDIIFFTRQLSSMLSSGLTLLRSL